MYIVSPSFCNNQYSSNYHLNNNLKYKASFDNSMSSNANLSKAGVENYKANYMVNFKGRINHEKTNSSGIGTLNFQTAFFREPNTDVIVQDYILENFSNDEEINIVSGACSSGEEAKSYAMLLDTLNDKLNISGFDISPEILKEAESNSCQLTKSDDDNSLFNSLSLGSENILLTDDVDNLTEYERKCRDKFEQYYQPKGVPHKVPVFPNAKQELEDLEALLADREEFEFQKKQYDEQMQAVKSSLPEILKCMPSISFEETIKMQKRALEQQVETYNTVAEFETEEHAFDNCSFVAGDVTNIENMYNPNSINVLLYRNALYHTLCNGDNMFRYMKDDSPETMDSIAKQMNKVLKPNGLVVFGENERMQGIDTSVINEAMENNGFKLLPQRDEGCNNNIWVKCEDV
ncbi:MAG: methyltransferase domain-containing protein [Candidatus Gastranaerophilales bacterium]|nr:methyltransferase domain-containing protein [Candidatus Gastranaerophilales bacterium]